MQYPIAWLSQPLIGIMNTGPSSPSSLRRGTGSAPEALVVPKSGLSAAAAGGPSKHDFDAEGMRGTASSSPASSSWLKKDTRV